jgi:hypothetical protein
VDRLKFTANRVTYKPGLVTEVFADIELKNRVKTRLDHAIEANWGLDPPDPAAPADHFSVRWQGWILPPRKGKYTLHLHNDDFARLFIDHKLTLDAWMKFGKNSVEVQLDARPYHLQVEHREGVGPAMMLLGWTPPGGREGPVPPEVLFHDLTQEKLLPR